MKRDGTPFITASESPRPFSEVVAERPEPQQEDIDAVPMRDAHGLPLYANRGYAHLKGKR